MFYKIIFTFSLILFSQLLQAEVTISVDRNPVVADETFKLIFKTDQKLNDEPDFNPLKKYFTILSAGRSITQSYSNVNKNRVTTQWTLTVIANQTGTFDIPPVQFGNELSKPTQIKIIESPTSKEDKQTDDIFIDVEVDTDTPYVQAQVIYTVKLYRAVQTSDASLTEPELSGGQALIKKLGEDKSFETHIKGKRYVVIQRQYVISPQSSGTLKISPLIFQGQTGAGSFFRFDPFGPQPKSIIRRSDSIQLEVKSIPESFSGNTWLPASQLSIQEQWSVAPDKLKQGEATTRTLTLMANGLSASNLPAIDSQLPEKLKQYPDQPEMEEVNNGNGFLAFRREKMAIIPTEAGDYVLPAIKIPWWNTEEDKQEIAELPERTIHVEVSATMPTPPTQGNNAQQQDKTVTQTEKVIGENFDAADSVADQTPWKWISLILFALWLITLYILLKGKRKPVDADTISDGETSRRQYLKQLKQACTANDPVAAKQALLNWAKIQWPDKNINSINAIKTFCDEDLKLKFDELNAGLYGKSESQWNGMAFLTSFESQSFDKKVNKQEKGKLEPLYKT